jgi:hypothetical protein
MSHGDLLGEIAAGDPRLGQSARSSVREKTTLGISFIGAA